MQRIDTVPDLDDEELEIEAPATVAPSAVGRREPVRWARWLPIAAAVQTIAIAGLLGALWLQSQTQDDLTAPRYAGLTAPAETVTRVPAIRVVFSGDVALDDMNHVLRAINAQIIAGPSEANVYTLGLAANAADKSDIEKAIAQLRADGHVMFAERTPEAP